MQNKRALYEEVLLDHTKHPRNFRALADADYTVEGYNPLCGDQFTVYIKLKDDIIEEVSFTGNGCAVSKASASMMTSQLKGRTIEQAKSLFKHFHRMLTSPPDAEIDESTVGKLRVFSGVREYPMRIKCATLAWHTLANALEGKENTTSTE